MRSFFVSLLLLGTLLLPQLSFAQCVPDSTVPSPDGIYPSSLDLPGCQFFDTTVTFILPRDTTGTAGGITVTAPFISFVIDSITGLPDGVDWECNLSPGCEYVVHRDSMQEDTIGCIRFFGTANIPSLYSATVHLTASFVLFGQITAQPSTLVSPINIRPCSFIGDCYTLSLDSNCEPATLSIQNNVPSNGRSGFDYSWSIGSTNGFTFSSQDENPADQMLNLAGEYYVNYEASVDTIGYSIINARIDAVNCTDALDAGDLYWYFIAPNGDTLFNTAGNAITNGGANLPILTGISTSILDSGTYTLQVWDFDLIGADDGCATNTGGSGADVSLTIPPSNGDSLTVSNGGLTVTYFFNHPVQTISCSDTINIFPIPDAPMILADNKDTLPSGAELEWCVTSTLELSASGDTTNGDSIEWYLDGAQIPSKDGIIQVMAGGNYEAFVVAPGTFCRSAPTTVNVVETSVLPPAVVRVGDTIFVGSANAQLTYTWFDLTGTELGQGDSFSPPTSGQFYATATDNMTGCQSIGSDTLQLTLTNVEELLSGQINLYPNPANGFVMVKTAFDVAQETEIVLRDLLGRNIKAWKHGFHAGEEEFRLDLTGTQGGIYLLEVKVQGQSWTQKLVLSQQ